MRPLFCVAPVAATLALSWCAPAAHAARLPGHVFSYRDLSGYTDGVSAAFAAWNRSAANVRFKPALRGRTATITVITRELDPGIAGQAEMPGHHVWLAPDLEQYDMGPDLPPALTSAALTAEHEIGHALGLDHSATDCALMNPSGYDGKPECDLDGDAVRCGPQAEDVRRMVARYGPKRGRSTAELSAPGFGTCSLPADLGDGPDGDGGAATGSSTGCTTTSDGSSTTTVCTTSNPSGSGDGQGS